MSKFQPGAPSPARQCAAVAVASLVFALGACSEPTAPTPLASRSAAPAPSASAGVCPAPGTQLPGALNMLADPTMGTVPMARDAAQGNAGMYIAVGKSGC